MIALWALGTLDRVKWRRESHREWEFHFCFVFTLVFPLVSTIFSAFCFLRLFFLSGSVQLRSIDDAFDRFVAYRSRTDCSPSDKSLGLYRIKMRRPRSQQQFMRRSLYTARRRRNTVAGESCVNRKTIQRRILNGGEIVGNKRGDAKRIDMARSCGCNLHFAC